MIATVEAVAEECSSAGGTHVLFAAGPLKIHFGGHGVRFERAFAVGEIFEIDWEPVEPRRSIENRKWCVPAWTIDGRATAVRLADRAK